MPPESSLSVFLYVFPSVVHIHRRLAVTAFLGVSVNDHLFFRDFHEGTPLAAYRTMQSVAAAGRLWLASHSRPGDAGHMGATLRSPVDGGCCERSRYHSRVAGLCVVGLRQRPSGSCCLWGRVRRALFRGCNGVHLSRIRAQENIVGSCPCRHRARARHRLEARSGPADAVTQGPTAAADSRPAGSSKGR